MPALARLSRFIKRANRLVQVSARFDAVDVVQVGNGTQSLGGSLEVRLDMLGRVVYLASRSVCSKLEVATWIHFLPFPKKHRHHTLTSIPHLEAMKTFSLAPSFSLKNLPIKRSLCPDP